MTEKQYPDLTQIIRDVGGIVHSDGNIFFKNADVFIEAAVRAMRAPQPQEATPSQDAEDAARYRYLRECNSASLVVVEITGTGDEDWHVLTEADADAAIDAAIDAALAQAKESKT